MCARIWLVLVVLYLDVRKLEQVKQSKVEDSVQPPQEDPWDGGGQ